MIDALLSSVVTRVSVRTALTPEVSYTGAELAASYRDPTPNPALAFLRPVVTIETPLGTQRIAPYGEPTDARGTLVLVACGALVLGALAVFIAR